jgi:hypothetical protein
VLRHQTLSIFWFTVVSFANSRRRRCSIFYIELNKINVWSPRTLEVVLICGVTSLSTFPLYEREVWETPLSRCYYKTVILWCVSLLTVLVEAVKIRFIFLEVRIRLAVVSGDTTKTFCSDTDVRGLYNYFNEVCFIFRRFRKIANSDG